MVAGVQWFGWLLSILAALLLTGFQYYWLIQSARNKTLTERRWVFPVIFRFTAWILLFLLIQGPWITLHSVIESKPRVILYLDSSESVSRNDKKRIAIAAEKLAELLPSWHVERYYFGADVWRGTNGDTARSINNGWVKSTNFQRLFEHQRQERFKYGLEAAVIMTDGIANDGLSTQSLRSPEGVLVSGIGVGDTNQYADVVVKSLWLNKEIFVGNSGEIELVVGVKNAKSLVTAKVYVQGAVVGNQSFIPSGNGESKRLIFSIPKQLEVGLKSVKVQLLLGEFEKITVNNERLSAFKVVNNKKVIGLVGETIDPDMGAIRRALQGYDPLESKLISVNEFEKAGVDALIMFGVPLSMGSTAVIVQRLKRWMDLGKSVMIIPKKELDLRVINELSTAAELSISAPWQETQAAINAAYSGFSMDELLRDRWTKFPPLQCLLQNFSIVDKSKILMYQRWSGVKTDIPLQWNESYGKGNLMICLGSGFWRWGLFEQKQYQNQEGFQQWVRRSLGILSAGSSDNERLSIELPGDGVDIGVSPTIRLIYRDLDGVANTAVTPSLTLTKLDSKPKDLKSTSNTNASIKISIQKNDAHFEGRTFPLEPGLYKVSASVNVGNDYFDDYDLLVVNSVSKEKMGVAADLQWLNTLTKTSGGTFAYLGELEKESQKGEVEKISSVAVGIANNIKNTVIADRILSDETRNWHWYELSWLLLALVSALSLEWSFRKWLGKY